MAGCLDPPSKRKKLQKIAEDHDLKAAYGKPAMSKDLWASVINTFHLKESVFELGIEVETKLEEGRALLRVITPGNPDKYAGPLKSSDLRYAAQVLNQAAGLLETKRKVKHFVITAVK
jgi:hypothetical protein